MMSTFSMMAQQYALNQMISLELAETFTKREYEIMELLESNFSNQELAKRLFISESTLRFHLKNIYRKLQVRNRSGAIAKARYLNILPRRSTTLL